MSRWYCVHRQMFIRYSLTARTKEIAPATHVIVLTSYDTPEYREAAAQAGASGFLVKGTVGMDEIAAVIQTAMQR